MPVEGGVACVTHRLPGRARIRLLERRGAADSLADVAQALTGVDGVQHVDINPLTGGLLILHDGSLEPILAHARRKGLFEVDPAEPAGPPPVERLRRQFGELSRELRHATDGAADLATLVFLILVVLAIGQLLRGRMLAPAITLLSYAAGALLAGQFTAGDEGADRAPGAPAVTGHAEGLSAR